MAEKVPFMTVENFEKRYGPLCQVNLLKHRMTQLSDGRIIYSKYIEVLNQGGQLEGQDQYDVIAEHETRKKDFEEVKDSGQRTDFGTGAVRDMQKGKGMPHLLPTLALRR